MKSPTNSINLLFFVAAIILLVTFLNCDLNDSISTGSKADSGTDTDTNNVPYIIADHTAVEDYEQIPGTYLNQVKQMVLWYMGESHSYQIRGGKLADSGRVLGGLELLETADSNYGVEVRENPANFTGTNVLKLLRGSFHERWGWNDDNMGEEHYWSTETVLEKPKMVSENYSVDVAIWCWCWDIPWRELIIFDANDRKINIIRDRDKDGIEETPNGNWGTEHMQIYLNAFKSLNDNTNSNTVSVYQTAVTDTADEGGHLTQLYNDQMRAWVKANGGYLFDWADIEVYNDDNSEKNTESWMDTAGILGTPEAEYNYEKRHDQWSGEEVGHATQALAIRKAKALWWLLARIAGWDGN